MYQTKCVVCGRLLTFPFPVKRSKLCDAHYATRPLLPRKPPPIGADGNSAAAAGDAPKVLATF